MNKISQKQQEINYEIAKAIRHIRRELARIGKPNYGDLEQIAESSEKLNALCDPRHMGYSEEEMKPGRYWMPSWVYDRFQPVQLSDTALTQSQKAWLEHIASKPNRSQDEDVASMEAWNAAVEWARNNPL